jgi:pimeloyl-ACP methyl ester carboxylesterase
MSEHRGEARPAWPKSQRDRPGSGIWQCVREYGRTTRQFLRPLPAAGPHAPLPPPLPDGRIVYIPGRGETMVREAPGPGGGPAVVLLHGWTLSADLNWFTGVYEVATRHGHMVAPDIRGHGRGLRSEEPFTLQAAADDVAGLLRELGLGPAVLVGYSMGSSIALLMAHTNPDVVAGLVLASSGLQWRASLYERALWGALAGVEYVLRFGAPEGITDRYLRHAVHQSPDLGPYRSWLKAEARRGDASDIAAAGRQLANYDAGALAEGVDVPTVVVVTRHDLLIRAHKQRQLAKVIGARTVEVDGAHNAWMVKPVEFAQAIDEGLGIVLGELGHDTTPLTEEDEDALGPRGVPAASSPRRPDALGITSL